MAWECNHLKARSHGGGATDTPFGMSGMARTWPVFK